MTRLLPLLVLALLLACCPVPNGANVEAETVFSGQVESASHPYATVTLNDGTSLRLSLAQLPSPVGLVPGSRVYVEGVFGDGLVVVRRIALL